MSEPRSIYETGEQYRARAEREAEIERTMADIPRRARLDRCTPAELAIYAAMQEVEKAGADERLTDAIVFLGMARHAVADFVDGVPASYNYGRFLARDAALVAPVPPVVVDDVPPVQLTPVDAVLTETVVDADPQA